MEQAPGKARKVESGGLQVKAVVVKDREPDPNLRVVKFKVIYVSSRAGSQKKYNSRGIVLELRHSDDCILL